LQTFPVKIFFTYIQLVIARAKICGTRAAPYVQVEYEGKRRKIPSFLIYTLLKNS